MRTTACHAMIGVVAVCGLVATSTPVAVAREYNQQDAASHDEARDKRAVRPWKSVGIKARKRAPGARWVGGWKVKGTGQLAYRLDPTRRTPRALGPVTFVSAAGASTGRKNKRTGTVRATARAAWIVSEYGPYKRSRAQGAAVEVALHSLVQSKAWGVKGNKARKRLRWSSQRRVIRKYARVMLKQSRKQAGPYTITLNPPAADLGLPTTLSATVLSASGTPMKGVDLDFTVAGMASGSATTNRDGHGAVKYTPPTPGTAEVTVTASGLPDETLRIVGAARPKRNGARFVLMGKPVPRTADQVLSTLARPTVNLAASDDPDAGPGVPFSNGTFQLSGLAEGGEPVTATTSMYGPFPNSSEAKSACANRAGPSAVGSAINLPTSGKYQAGQGLTIPTEGWWSFRVSTSGNNLNHPTSECGPPFSARRRLGVTASATVVGIRDVLDPHGGLLIMVRVNATVTNLPSNPPPTIEIAGWTENCATRVSSMEGKDPDGDGTYSAQTAFMSNDPNRPRQFTARLPGTDRMKEYPHTCGQAPLPS